MPYKTLSIAATDGIGSFPALIDYPEGGRGPAVVLCHGAAGLDGFMRETVELYAEEGYVTIAPDLTRNSDASKALDDIGAVLRYLRAQEGVGPRVGVLGFGEGGRLALEAAANLSVDAVVVYCGGGLERQPDSVPRLRCPVALHFAGDDPAVPPAAVARIREAFGALSGAEVYLYPGAAPGFYQREDASFSKAYALLAHDRSIGLLRRTMGPHFDLAALWEHHRNCEFEIRDTAQTMATMVASPYVNHIPTMTGGVGYEQLARFYKYHFIPKNSTDRSAILVSRTIGPTQIVEEFLARFVHDREIDWMLPGIKPTGRKVEIPLVVIVKFRGAKLYHEHIYWDQASVLAQIGLLDPKGLPVAGVEQARKLLDESQPSNSLLTNWSESEGLPIP